MLKALIVWITKKKKKNLQKIIIGGNTRSPYLPPEKPVLSSRRNSYNQTWKNRLVQNWERSMSRMYIATLLI